MDLHVKRLVYAICADYPRRAKLLNIGRLPMETAATYARLNAAIENAVDRNIEKCDRKDMMRSLQDRRGYNSGGVTHRGRNQFYKAKMKIIEEIASSLNLI
ncbi:MAG: hypothetical protein IJX39_08785 [Clostridia bacterium]|nr:hypothetical protein [Clostridia bacterium]